MKLVSSVSRIERGRRKAARRLAIIWSADELKLGRPLAEGEYLATDLCMVIPERPAGSPPDDKPLPGVITQSRERATRDPLDLGDVYDSSGAVVEKVWDVIPASAGCKTAYFYTCPVGDEAGLRQVRGAMSGGSGRL